MTLITTWIFPEINSCFAAIDGRAIIPDNFNYTYPGGDRIVLMDHYLILFSGAMTILKEENGRVKGLLISNKLRLSLRQHKPKSIDDVLDHVALNMRTHIEELKKLSSSPFRLEALIIGYQENQQLFLALLSLNTKLKHHIEMSDGSGYAIKALGKRSEILDNFILNDDEKIKTIISQEYKELPHEAGELIINWYKKLYEKESLLPQSNQVVGAPTYLFKITPQKVVQVLYE